MSAAQIEVQEGLDSGQLVLDDGRATPGELHTYYTRLKPGKRGTTGP